MLVMMLLALFAWLLPKEAWAEDYVGNRSKYKVWIEGMNVIKAELPCYDKSGSDTWQTDGWLYYHTATDFPKSPVYGQKVVAARWQHKLWTTTKRKHVLTRILIFQRNARKCVF
jgi:hypothetical protein